MADEKICPDCDRAVSAGYSYAVHRAIKHSDWSLLDNSQKERFTEFIRKALRLQRETE